MDHGMLIRDTNDGWHIANDYVIKIEPKAITPIDVAAEHIRKMIDLK
jgi:hypothetical protein